MSKTKDPPIQPIKCKGCPWGNWEGSKQFCSKQKCVKEKKPSHEGL